MIATVILFLLVVVMGVYLIYYLYDIYQHRDCLEKHTSCVKTGAFGFICLFFDVLGIGAFAPHTTLYHRFHQVDDYLIPGTLNVGNAVPTIIQALIFIQLVKVDTLTLVTMLLSSVIGSYLGASIVAKMDERKIRLSMGIALLITALFMFLSAIGVMDIGGNAMGLTGIKLIVAIVINFILGALMTVGVGLYSPCMALVSLLGMSPTIAFPIMMGSCAFLMPVCGVKFIQSGMYNRKAALSSTIAGSVGVLLAAFIVKSLPLQVLRWGVVVVVIYTACSMLKAGLKKSDE
ncbi:MAG: sulfite exporter TauE/SafE family protein [Coprobacillus cateniformis]|uniref:sulfite exporter TauE/SafE family protein n=1 Tax=Longibaculum muris TaxID=1796628 RepID=UPI003AB76AF2|nr:sulfite exporter TauE/SafE family protein [Coprobacillus cateniformis]